VSFTCLEVAKVAKLAGGTRKGSEVFFNAPYREDQVPSLRIHAVKDVWRDDPTDRGGNAWSLAAACAGCSPDDKSAVRHWLAERGLTNGNCARPQSRNGRAKPTRWHGHPIKRWYTHTDVEGNSLYEVARVEYTEDGTRKKEFPVWCNKTWGLKDKGIDQVPYHVHRLAAASDIFVVEGQKDVETLEALGYTATTASKWVESFRAYFRPDQHVIVLRDNDEKGLLRALEALNVLHGHVASLKFINEFPGGSAKGYDVSDFIAGKDPVDAGAELSDLADKAPAWKPPGKETIEFIEFAPSFLAFEDPPVEYIHPEITPRGVLKCSHGDPRTMKSLAALEEAIAAATATPAFGLERFRPARAFKVLYSSQEDAAPRVRARAKALLRGRGITNFPETLAFAVHKGIDLDIEEWRERFFKDVMRHGFDLIVLDPIRTYTAQADKGPSDVIPVAKFLRRFIVEGVTVHLVHHDTKPSSAGPDARRRSHRASGGGWFSVSECPVAFEKIGESQSLVIPEDFKFSSDPMPFTIRYSEEDSGRIIRLIGEDSTAEEARALAVDQKVLAYLTANPGSSGNAITKGVHARKEGVFDALDRLFKANKVDCVERGKGKYWAPRRVEHS